MDLSTVSAFVFVVVTIGAVGFQLALAAGAPWGAYAMGGRVTGRFPPPLWVPVASVMLATSLVVALVG